MPSIFTQIKSFTKAVIKWAASGFSTSKRLQKKRMIICRACDDFNSEEVRCMDCGCKLLYKTLMRTESCPQNKW